MVAPVVMTSSTSMTCSPSSSMGRAPVYTSRVLIQRCQEFLRRVLFSGYQVVANGYACHAADAFGYEASLIVASFA